MNPHIKLDNDFAPVGIVHPKWNDDELRIPSFKCTHTEKRFLTRDVLSFNPRDKNDHESQADFIV